MSFPDHASLVAALSAAGSAHHDYETRFLKGVRDDAWPGWYAAYVLGRLGDFASPTDLSTLALGCTLPKTIGLKAAASHVLAKMGSG